MNLRNLVGCAAAFAAIAVVSTAPLAAPPDEGSATALKAKYETLRAKPDNPFGIPLYIESRQAPDTLAGDIHARIDKRFEVVRDELSNPRAWCEILMLHPNVKGCSVEAGDAALTVRLGSAETPARFTYRVARPANDYLAVRLNAAEGPLGTTDYAFRVEATPLDAQSTLLHLGYSHGYGARAKLALRTYFNTFGRGKVGFTVVDRTADGKPVYVDDLRGGLERNAMRYYLAIQAHLEALAAPADQRLERGMQAWLKATERYPLQLKEESGFVERKRGELARFRSQATASTAQASGG